MIKIIHKEASNQQDILKILALLSMLIDHLGLYLFPGELWMRMVGRFAMPIFAFYAGFNFKGRVRHSIWLLGIMLVIFSKICFFNAFSNILISLAVGQLYLKYFGESILRDEQIFLRHFLAMIIFTPFTFVLMDYGTLTIIFMQIGYLFANKENKNHYLILASICLMIFNQIIYNLEQISYFVGMILFIAASSFWISIASHKSSMKINLNFISRNMLYVYFASSVMLMIASLKLWNQY